MKKELNPAVVIAALVLIVAGVGYFLISKTGGNTEGTSQNMPMPTEAKNMMRDMMGQKRPGGPGKTAQ